MKQKVVTDDKADKASIRVAFGTRSGLLRWGTGSVSTYYTLLSAEAVSHSHHISAIGLEHGTYRKDIPQRIERAQTQTS